MTPMREQAGRLLTSLRGDVTRTAVAERLGISRQSLMKLEAGGLSIDRLDAVGEAYGVEFHLVACLPGDAPAAVYGELEVPAPALADLLPATAVAAAVS